MLLTTVKNEYIFNCQCRKLAEKTIKNYSKQIDYLLDFLKKEKEITEIEKVTPQYIKEFLMKMKQSGRKVSYFNDLLKAYKVYFRYAYNEGYTATLLTEKIQNAAESNTENTAENDTNDKENFTILKPENDELDEENDEEIA